MKKSYQIIGNIILAKNVNEEFVEYVKKNLPRIKTICEIKKIKGIKRTPEIKKVWGNGFETIHKENGVMYKINVKQIMFSKGNLLERKRIIPLIKENETIIDMFSGIGYFTLQIAKHTKVNKIYAIEINPIAYKYLVENIKLNKVEDKVIPILGDCREKIKELPKADKILMGYFPNTEEYLPYAISKIKKNGVIHYHNIAKSKEELIKPLEKYKVHILKIKKVKSFAPKIWHWVVDFKLL